MTVGGRPQRRQGAGGSGRLCPPKSSCLGVRAPADSPRPVIADPDQDGSDPMFERLVQVEGELALAHYNLTEARAQAEYAVRRERLTDQAIEQLAEERRLRAELVNSTSWRITRPLRALGRALGRASGAIGRR